MAYVTTFAGSAMPTLPEIRLELMREAQWHLTRWERDGDPADYGAFEQALDDLALLSRAGRELGF